MYLVARILLGLTNEVNVRVAPLLFLMPTFPLRSRLSGSIVPITLWTSPRGTAKLCTSLIFFHSPISQKSSRPLYFFPNSVLYFLYINVVTNVFYIIIWQPPTESSQTPCILWKSCFAKSNNLSSSKILHDILETFRFTFTTNFKLRFEVSRLSFAVWITGDV
jgi:hypothetical protein